MLLKKNFEEVEICQESLVDKRKRIENCYC